METTIKTRRRSKNLRNLDLFPKKVLVYFRESHHTSKWLQLLAFVVLSAPDEVKKSLKISARCCKALRITVIDFKDLQINLSPMKTLEVYSWAKENLSALGSRTKSRFANTISFHRANTKSMKNLERS